MKYIDADRLKEQIQGLINLGYDKLQGNLYHVLNLIASLQQEQPEVDLEKDIKEWVDLMVGASFPEQDGDFISEEDYRSVIRKTAIHFLGLNAKEESR